jgi:hypothetical protein
MGKVKNIIILIILMFGIPTVNIYTLLIYHENIHKVICESVDGTANITYDIKGGHTDCLHKDNELTDFQKYNIINEFIGYYFNVLLLIIFSYPIYLAVTKEFLYGKR